MLSLMFSLCIPTLDRYEDFLCGYIKKYLHNPLIDEIIISDENGNDYEKLLSTYKDTIHMNKLRLYKNNTVLGPFLNKIQVCKYAKNDWICLMDSDNFADNDYFETMSKYIKENKLPQYCIVSPCFAFPKFDYSSLAGKIITKNNIQFLRSQDTKKDIEMIMNTGNYILSKKLINELDITREQNIQLSPACDVIYMNTLFFEQFDLEFHILDVKYSHVVHKGSIYLQTYKDTQNFINYAHDRFRNLGM